MFVWVSWHGYDDYGATMIRGPAVLLECLSLCHIGRVVEAYMVRVAESHSRIYDTLPV